MCLEFCNETLKAEINCNQASCDGYDVKNLISSNFSQRSRGFLGASFVRPPIEITVRFLCGIELHYIRISSRVGEQKSVGFEVHSRVDMPGDKKDTDSYLLGKAFLTMEDELYFVNRNFRRSCACTLPVQNSMIFVKNMGHHFTQAFANASAITIRIFKTDKSTVPSLKRLEIWAEPSRFLSQIKLIEVTAYITKLEKTSNNDLIKLKSAPKNKPKRKHAAASSSNVKGTDDEREIPAEFLDAITHTIMVLPLVLPSGNCIDQSTLDKYSNSEAAWGRVPNDPFTGIPFNQEQKPLVNSSLKARIDLFLLKNECVAKNLGRTIGRSDNTLQKSSSSLVPSVLVTQERTTSNTNKATLDNFEFNPSKRTKCSESIEKSSHKVLKVSTHEENVRESLNSSLKDILSNLKSYVKKPPKSEPCHLCIFCCVKPSEYRLPCFHTVCKTCLCLQLKQKTSTCSECQRPFVHSEPVKIHCT